MLKTIPCIFSFNFSFFSMLIIHLCIINLFVYLFTQLLDYLFNIELYNTPTKGNKKN